MALKWYIIHVYSGFENKVKAALEERIASSSHAEKFGEVVVPTEEIVELVGSPSNVSYRKLPQDDPKVRKPDITRAKEILNWSPKIKRSEGLKITYDYFKKVLS